MDVKSLLLNLSTIFAYLTRLSRASEYGFTIQVPAGQMECFWQTIDNENATTVELDYQVVDGGDMDIGFILNDPKNNLVANDDPRTDSSHKFDVSQSKGDYQICFDNSFSYSVDKVVYFQMFVYDADGNTEELDFKSAANAEINQKFQELGMTVESFTNGMSRIKNHLNRAEHMQMILRAFEYRDKVIMEANLSRVNFWSIVTLVLMLSVSISQVYVIKSLFQDHSKMSKILRQRT